MVEGMEAFDYWLDDDTQSEILTTQDLGRTAPALFVGLVADAPHTPPARISLAEVDRVDIVRGPHRRVDLDGRVARVSLADLRLSRSHARLTRMGATWLIEDLQSTNGTRVGNVRIERVALCDRAVVAVGHTMLVYREHGGERPTLLDMPSSITPELVTLSPTLVRRFADLPRAARSGTCIEICGESGTGKELVARAIHELSGLPGNFVAVNCGALPSSLVEGELFGHRKGAYTGASNERVGLVRSADGGTLFLDEVAELPATSQAALLRVLQEGEVVPLGADRVVKVDVRIVTATNRDLDAEVAAGRFRADLRARLLGVHVRLPPLRDRSEDLAHIIATLLDRVAPKRDLAFSLDAALALYGHDWPLNIRELERAIGAAAAVAVDRIDSHHLPAVLTRRAPPQHALPERLVSAIAQHRGNLAAGARELGKDRTQIRRWIKRFGLSRTPS